MKTKIKWTFSNDSSHFFQKDRLMNKWGEYESGKLMFKLSFETFDGDSVILFNKSNSQYIQIDTNRVIIGSDKIESLDSSSIKTYDGKWTNDV